MGWRNQFNQISDLNFVSARKPYGGRPSPVNLRSPWLWLSGIAAGWAVPLVGLVWFSLATCLPTSTSPHWMPSERSIRCSLPVRQRQRRDPSQHAAKTLPREMPFGQQQPATTRMFHQSSAGCRSLRFVRQGREGFILKEPSVGGGRPPSFEHSTLLSAGPHDFHLILVHH